MRALLLLAPLAVLLALPASAHNWYGKYRDPIYGYTSCCGGQDCAPLPPGAITNEPGGLRIRLTLEQAQAINPRRTEAFDEFIPLERIQLSEDGQPHICLQKQNYRELDDPRRGFFCIFMPPNS